MRRTWTIRSGRRSPIRLFPGRAATIPHVVAIAAALLLLGGGLVEAAARTWVVSSGGSDRADGSRNRALDTIQRAIDLAAPGDTVTVTRGRYSGPGNGELRFRGKAIVVRSENPASRECLDATVIDGGGQGTICRFVDDETPRTIFEGFTLIPGDTSQTHRGAPGLFELSRAARPTVRAIRIAGDLGPPTSGTPDPRVLPLYPRLAWDGTDPFHQPFPTTDYHGSGDANADGELTVEDAAIAQSMAQSATPVSWRADVDGDGDVDAADVSRIQQALGGNDLPGWWNRLTSRAERDAWIDRVLTLDPTDEHPHDYWFQCLSFAWQLHIHGAFYRGDLTSLPYDGGRTSFNVPMYATVIAAPDFGHAINAVLIGDDPLSFDDWRFIEPQTDHEVQPGMWDMPYNSYVKIDTATDLYPGGSIPRVMVMFLVDQGGWQLIDHDPDLVLSRPASVDPEPDNGLDAWNPRVVPGDPPRVIFDMERSGTSGTTDLHLTDLDPTDLQAAVPLTHSPQLSRLLDLTEGPDGRVHVLWYGKDGYELGVFHAVLDDERGELTDVTRVSTGNRIVRMGRILATPSGELHVFWFEAGWTSGHPHPDGVYWARSAGTGWTNAVNVTPNTSAVQTSYPMWTKPDHLRYKFDVEIRTDGAVELVWVDGSRDGPILRRSYDGAWEPAETVESGDARGVDLARGESGTLHLVYWTVPSPTLSRGNFYHSRFDGGAWSPPVGLDAGGAAGFPRLASQASGRAALVWDVESQAQNQVLWSVWDGDGWSAPLAMPSDAGADACYPNPFWVSGDSLAVVWTSRSPGAVSIGLGWAGDMTPVALESFVATPTPDGISLDWRTAREVDVVGFNLHRTISGSDDWALLNDEIIASGRRSYRYVDDTVISDVDYRFRLTEVTSRGSEHVLGVITATASLAPGALRLQPGVPNPFGHATVVEYTVPWSGVVTVDVFDLSGRWIRRLADSRREPGVYRVTWNGRDHQGHLVAAGAYLVRLRAGESAKFQRIVRIR